MSFDSACKLLWNELKLCSERMILFTVSAWNVTWTQYISKFIISFKNEYITHTHTYKWSDNKVHELTAVKVIHSSLLNIIWLPSKYSPWEAMHWSQRLVHPSEQFWSWFCGMAFRAAIVLLLMSSKCLAFNISFIFGNRKKSVGVNIYIYVYVKIIVM
jgi:hypothetical protein